MTHAALDTYPASIRRRIAMERRIVKAIIKAGTDAGYELSVNDGEHSYPWSADPKTVYGNLFKTDEESIRFRKDGKWVGSVLLVYGNDGYDVLRDYSTALSDLLAPVEALAEKLERAA
jgi:hypothetical protein